MTARLYDPNRLKQPLKRIGPKGEGKFAPISWEEAIDTITFKWNDLLEMHGPESILPYSFYGNMGNLSAEGMDRRFFTNSVQACLSDPFVTRPAQSDTTIQWVVLSASTLKKRFIQSFSSCGALMR